MGKAALLSRKVGKLGEDPCGGGNGSHTGGHPSFPGTDCTELLWLPRLLASDTLSIIGACVISCGLLHINIARRYLPDLRRGRADLISL